MVHFMCKPCMFTRNPSIPSGEWRQEATPVPTGSEPIPHPAPMLVLQNMDNGIDLVSFHYWTILIFMIVSHIWSLKNKVNYPQIEV